MGVGTEHVFEKKKIAFDFYQKSLLLKKVLGFSIDLYDVNKFIWDALKKKNFRMKKKFVSGVIFHTPPTEIKWLLPL